MNIIMAIKKDQALKLKGFRDSLDPRFHDGIVHHNEIRFRRNFRVNLYFISFFDKAKMELMQFSGRYIFSL